MRINKRMINVITGLLIKKTKSSFQSKIHHIKQIKPKFQTIQSVYRCDFAMDHNHRPLVAIKKNTGLMHICVGFIFQTRKLHLSFYIDMDTPHSSQAHSADTSLTSKAFYMHC